jgi:hypothetical protein
MRPPFSILAIMVPSMLGPSPAVLAQTTRTEVIEQQRAEKASRLEPYKPGRIETFILNAEEGKLRRLISPHNGFFAEYGYTYKPIGSGIGLGGGFRHDVLDRRARVLFETGATFRKYAMARAAFEVPTLARGRLSVGAEGVYRHHTQDDYYGLGDDTLSDDRVSFGYDDREVQGHATYALKPWLNVGARGGWLAPTLDSGSDTRFLSIEQRFDDSSAPGLAQQADFAYAEGFAEVDYRDEPGNARAGGYYLLAVRRYADRDLNRYSFRASQLLLQQFVPIFDKKRVFAFQLGVATSNPDSGDEVPFYMQPTLGGSRTLRSEADYRYRDQNVVWMNAEYRWEAFSALDMALFTDWGNVAPRLSDLDFTDLKHAYGIGFRFNTAQAVFLRIDIAAGGNDGIRYFFKFSKAF